MHDAQPGGASHEEPPALAIRAQGLSKTYRGLGGEAPKKALKAIDLEIPRGSVFGLLGPNGAGKSTFINILAGLVIKSGGMAQVWGHDIDREARAARAAIGVVPQELNIDPFFTPRELLEVQAGLFGVPRAERRTDEILAALSLSDKADAYARSLSGGMRRRLLVAKAIVHDPPVLVLDEPTAGVDVELRRQLWTYVRSLAARGTTVLLTTHYLEEAQELCDRIAIIDRGELVAHDSTEALLRRLDRKELAITVAEELTAVPAEMAELSVELAPPRRLIVRYKPSATRIGDILAAVRAAGLTISDLSTEESDLEDIFLALTGRSVAEGAPDSASAAE
ncbi:MAG: ABC transporter ATP-binding protein [Rhodospirillaceae bacterium]|nr:ABC transporter ATP-binding protein [Rhodospirillaceae bacterium]